MTENHSDAGRTAPQRTSGLWFVATLICLLFPLFSLSLQASPLQKGMGGINPVIGQIGNKLIAVQDVENKQINELRAELYKQLKSKLQLLALQNLARTNPAYRLDYQPSITDTDARDFYFKNNLQNRGTLEALLPRIKTLLQMKAISKYYDQLFQKALKEGLVVSYLQKPNEFLIKVPVETAHLWGGKRESVMVLEFSDYQCPFCSRVQSTIKTLRKKYRDQVVFGYRHSPLAFHKEADEAAIAAECARDQGRFKAYHDILFNNYRTIHPSMFEGFAREAGISDLKRFNNCVKAETHRDRIIKDQKTARKVGIQGTPAFVIGKYDRQAGVVIGEIISGAQPDSAFIELIDKYLKKQ